MSHLRDAAIFFTCLLLVGCNTTETPRGSNSLVTTYGQSCRPRLPNDPFCFYVEITNRRSFNECKQSTENYLGALEGFRDCAISDLRQILDQLLKKVPETFNCYTKYFAKHDKGSPTFECGKIKIPRFDQSLAADGVDAVFGLPNCVTDMSAYTAHDFAPRNRRDLKKCGEEIKIFLGKSSRLSGSLPSRTKAAQEQFNKYSSNLDAEISQKSEEAIAKFNCKAKRDRIC